MPGVAILLNQIAQAASVDLVWDLSLGYFHGLGFARVDCGLSRYCTIDFFGDPEDALFLCSNSPKYIQLYFGDGGYANGPLHPWILQNVGACTWRWVQDEYDAGKLSAAGADLIRANFSMGIVAGISISFSESTARVKGALGLNADIGMTHDDVDRIWATDGAQIMAVANMMNLKIAQLPLITRRRALTNRQREALEWAADGKTVQDAAILMRVSVSTVEKHLRLARDAMDVGTTAQAVAIGGLLNAISLRQIAPTAAAAILNQKYSRLTRP